MPIDPATLIAKVIERAAEKCGHLPGMAAAQALGDDALAELLSTQLLTYLGLHGNSGAPAQDTDKNKGDEPTWSEMLLAKNRRIARAIGACECWGEARGCNTCGGFGRPGWALPEKPQFDVFVRPALRAIRDYRLSMRSGRGTSLKA